MAKKWIVLLIAGVVVLASVGVVVAPKKKHETSTAPTKTYIALGDSVAAGDGLETASDTTACYRNKEGYPNLIAAKYNLSLINLSCSGAAVQNGLLASQTVNDLPLHAQLSALPTTPAPSLITLTIGANDTAWTSLLARCYTNGCGSQTDTDQVSVSLTSLRAHLDSALTTLATKYAPAPKIILTTYYSILPTDLTRCTTGAVLTAQQNSWVRAQTDRLNAVIQQAADAQKGVQVTRVDFTGHELCTSDSWIQDLSAKAPFHPNDAGQSAIADSIAHTIGSL